MPRLIASGARFYSPVYGLKLLQSRRVWLSLICLAIAVTCGIVIVRSADLSGPVILPGDLSTAPAVTGQYHPQVARGNSTFLAVWTDERTVLNSFASGAGRGTMQDIYGARLDASGSVIDTTPLIINEGQYRQSNPQVGWNGQNWLVAWQSVMETNPFYYEIRAARVSPDGTVLDSTPLLLHTADANSPFPAAVVSDGTNWVVLWEGFPQGGVARSVFVSRITNDGVVLDPDGREVYQHPSQFLTAPDLAFGGDGYLFTFVDIGQQNTLKGLRLNLDLNATGAPFNINPAGYAVGSAKPAVAFNGAYYLSVWENGFTQNTHGKLAASRISTAGQLLDPAPIILVEDMNSYSPQLDVCGDSNTWFASYDTNPGSEPSVVVVRMSAAGAPLGGTTVHTGSSAGLSSGFNGNAEAVFIDPTFAEPDVFGASISANGTASQVGPISLGAPRQSRPRIAKSNDGFLTVFRSQTATDSRILAQRLDTNGNPIDQEPIVVASGSTTNANPSVAFNGTLFLIVWETYTGNGIQTFGRRLTPEGVFLDAAPFLIMKGHEPDVAALGETFLVANIIPVTNELRYVQAVRVSSLGLVQGTPTRLEFNFNFFPRVAAFGTRWLVVWEFHSNHDDAPGAIKGAFVEPDGSSLGSFLVGNTTGNDVTPHLAVAGSSALVVWSNGDIHGRRINDDGTFPDPADGYKLIAAPNFQTQPAVAWDGSQYVLDWADTRNESYPVQPRGDIYGARVSITNITLEEFPVAASALPEDNPFVIANNGLSIFAYAKFYDTAPYDAYRITLRTAHFAPPDLGTVPAAPTNLVATEPNNSPNVNALSWTDNSNNERGFKIEYKIGPTGSWSQIAVVGPDVTTYSTTVNPNGPAYYYRVRAYDLAGDSAYTNEATPPNPAPTVNLTSPADGATYKAPALLVVNATASDMNGTVTQVEFFSGSASWGKDTTSPYSVSRFNVPAGTYTLRAVATDNRGAITTSAPITVTVTPQNDSLLWSQTGDNQSIIGPSVRTQTGLDLNKEVADDLDITGSVSRILMYGYRDFSAQPNPPVYGVYVRFYEWLNGTPGVLQNEQFIAAGSSNLVYDPSSATYFDITLTTPFTTSGKHFISVQLVTDGTPWFWLSSRTNSPRNSALYLRDNLAGGFWMHPANCDGAFSLYGTLTGRPRIDSLSQTSITRSGRLIVTGANFGGTQDASRVLIDNIPAIIAGWSDSSIRLYVPEAVNFGTVQVQVETVNGLSNPVELNVTPRQQNGRIKWRFTVDGGYVWQQAAVAPDGSVYFLNAKGQLFALSANGGLKWIKSAAPSGTAGHISVGSDGTIYIAATAQPNGIGTPFVGAVRALNPDGTQKWLFVAPDSKGVTIGPDVGPDGKIYVLFTPPSSATTPTLNLVALAPEDGHMVWNYYDRYGAQAQSGDPMAFDAQAGRLYFQSSSLTFTTGGKYAHRMDNGQREYAVSGGSGRLILAPDTSVHTSTQSFTPQLTLNWTFPLFGQGPTASHDVGTDSVHYLVQNYYRLYAINPNGTEKWHFDDCANNDCHILNDPVASPINQVTFVPGLLDFGQPGFFLGLNPTNGTELWRVVLPTEPGYGQYGQVRPHSRAVFALDGLTAYLSTDIADNYDYSYFYAVDTSGTLPCSVSISPQTAVIAANGGNGTLNVTATSTTCTWTVTSNANWLTVINGNSGTGNGTVSYNASANTTTSPRTGTLTINNQVYTVTQNGVQPDSPTVSITYPANNQTFSQPTSLFVAADATAASGRVLSRVEFYAGSTLIGTDSSAPYQIAWNNPATNTHALTARAIDNLGVATDSAPVYATLLPPDGGPMPLPVPPPTVTSPTAEATYTAPATITIEATRQASSYPTVRMEFYSGTTLIGTDTTAPYSFTWTDVPAGRYTLSVRNVASTGARANSQPIDITVNGESFNITGRVVNNDGVPLAGVAVMLGGSNSGNAVTDANGNYTFTNLGQGGSYTIAPNASGISFVPAQATFSGLHSDQSATFIAANGQQPTARAQTADFDGDGRTDLSVWQSTSGIWHVIKSANSAQHLQQWGQSSLGDLAAPGDYDGDRKTDIAIFRPSDGNWYILSSSTAASTILNWGQNGDLPVPADYDGDGKTDVAVFRPSEGNWYVRKSTGGSIAQGWGDSTDRLVPGDYDGDGKADIAVYRPTDGNWYIIRSTGGSLQVNWGLGNDRPVSGDYDGDDVADIAVYRPSEGNWYIRKSMGGNIIRNWGESTDRPVPGDYDGDGKTDIAVWRPSEATWYILLSSTNTVRVQYLGVAEDIPVPAAFIPQ